MAFVLLLSSNRIVLQTVTFTPKEEKEISPVSKNAIFLFLINGHIKISISNLKHRKFTLTLIKSISSNYLVFGKIVYIKKERNNHV